MTLTKVYHKTLTNVLKTQTPSPVIAKFIRPIKRLVIGLNMLLYYCVSSSQMERYSRVHDLHVHVNTHLVDNKTPLTVFALVVSPSICFGHVTLLLLEYYNF